MVSTWSLSSFLCASVSVCFVLVLRAMKRSEVGCMSSIPSEPCVLCTSVMVVDDVYFDGLPLDLQHCTTRKWQDVMWIGRGGDLTVMNF